MNKIVFFVVIVLLFGCANENKKESLKITGDYNIMIIQRGIKKIKGSKTDITIKLGDITSGRVNVTITDKKDINLEQVMESGEVLDFDYFGTKYSFMITELINHVFDDDYAEIILREYDETSIVEEKIIEEEVLDIDTIPQLTIESFIDSVANSGLIFIRNDKEYNSVQAAEHLRKKLNNSNKAKDMSFEEFVDNIATKSSMSGKAYKIRNADGSEELFSDWIKNNFTLNDKN